VSEGNWTQRGQGSMRGVAAGVAGGGETYAFR